MKTIILAGGTGTRLGDLTTVVNKHLLPLGPKPIISWAFETAAMIGDEVLLVTNPEYLNDFAQLATSDRHPYTAFRRIYFAAQSKPLGIAHAVSIGEQFAGSGPVFVLLGDNVFAVDDAAKFADVSSQINGAHVWVKAVDKPSDYGVLTLDGDTPVSIVEKPKSPTSNLAVTGAYAFDESVWDIMRALPASPRGEYEIADVLNDYLRRRALRHHVLDGDWLDVGHSVDGYWKASIRQRERETCMR